LTVSVIVGNYVPEYAGFLFYKVAMFGETIKETPSKMKHQEGTGTASPSQNILLHCVYS
jgi:hypothetical protein